MSNCSSPARSLRPAQLPRCLTRLAAPVALAVLLAACGGGDDRQTPAPAAGCSVDEQKSWLGGYMREWYFWSAIAPHPDPLAYATVQEYFDALLYPGGVAGVPADRWSRTESTESFNRFYGEGATLGYGLSVAGLEVAGQAGKPLRVRHVEPLSDAAAQGLRRGDELLSLNGRSAADIVLADDFSALSADSEGQQLALVLRDAAGLEHSVTLTARVFTLTPVTGASVVASPLGRRIGYVAVKDMIAQAQPPLAAAFRQFQSQGVDEVVLDLRYNGGGLVSVAGTVASHTVGTRVPANSAFAKLLYNDQRAAINNQTFAFGQPQPSFGLPRVFVLTGRRTCSASEQVVNGLRPFAEVVLIGETTCGKPVGFLPTSQCGTTYSVVNFESVNARDEGRYYDGFDATCAVADDLSRPQGDPEEALLQAALGYADSGACPPGTAARKQPLAWRPAPAVARPEPGERQDMIPR